jgi:hypothetical protein
MHQQQSLLIENVSENKSIKEILGEHCHSILWVLKFNRCVILSYGYT